MRTRGIGELLTPCAGLPSCYLVIACAGEGVSTPEAYRALDERFDRFEHTAFDSSAVEKLLYALQKGDLKGICNAMKNQFEEVVPQRNKYVWIIRQTLLESGAIGSMMSGSGPSVFGIFQTEAEAETGRIALQKFGVSGSVCVPVNREFSLC